MCLGWKDKCAFKKSLSYVYIQSYKGIIMSANTVCISVAENLWIYTPGNIDFRFLKQKFIFQSHCVLMRVIYVEGCQ